jgi:hypothetical protein
MRSLLVQRAIPKLIADTFALVTFAFAIGMFVEVVLSGLTLEQSIQSRLFAVPLNVIIARPYGQYRDWLFITAKAESRGRFIRTVTDITAFLTFMIPQYAAVLAWIGAGLSQILIACFSVVVLSLLVGRPYGLYLTFCRRLLEKIST